MLIISIICLALVALTTLIHYEVLSLINARLPATRIPTRAKLLVAVYAAFAAHALEITVYGMVLFILVRDFSLGGFSGSQVPSFTLCMYFSAETFTSLGFGDVIPLGPIRLLAGAETLNGLLLIGWSASYLYIAMERFWSPAALTP